jgi:hypothetical protein
MSDRPPRGGPGARPGGERRGFDMRDGPRGFGERDDRGVSERAEQRGEWAERAERMRRARPARGGAGGEMAGGDAPDAPDARGPRDARDHGGERDA